MTAKDVPNISKTSDIPKMKGVCKANYFMKKHELTQTIASK
jgi:hypothetical protein